MRRIKKLGIVGSGVCVLALTVASPAFADYAPTAKDVVGVGSDTVQNINDFVADGDPFGDGSGYNGTGNKYKMISFDATPDANDRAGYLANSVTALNPTIVLRQGMTPIQRPNGSGGGINALIADTTHKIDYVRSSRLLSAQNETDFETANGGAKLDTVQISTDPLQMAVATTVTSNAPAGGLTVQQIKDIYLCSASARTWNQVGGTGTNNIIPLVPQLGSGTRSTFLGDIGVTTPGPCVQTVEENDPSSITSAAQPTAAACSCTTVPANGTVDPADAIAPFSAGRLGLYNTGYFHNPNTPPFGAASITPGIALLPGVGKALTDTYKNVRGLYIIFRNSDLSLGAWQPGGTQNWANTLFWGAGSYYGSGQGDVFISAAGGVPSYLQLAVGAHS